MLWQLLGEVARAQPLKLWRGLLGLRLAGDVHARLALRG